MPTNNTDPDNIIVTEMNLELDLFAIMKEIPVSTDAGAAPIEINCRILAVDAMYIEDSIIKL